MCPYRLEVQAVPTPSLLIDCEEDRTLRAVVFGLLTEMERK
jgi:hypothetical protein